MERKSEQTALKAERDAAAQFESWATGEAARLQAEMLAMEERRAAILESLSMFKAKRKLAGAA